MGTSSYWPSYFKDYVTFVPVSGSWPLHSDDGMPLVSSEDLEERPFIYGTTRRRFDEGKKVEPADM